MVITQLFFVVIATRAIELFLESIYCFIKKFYRTNKREDHSTNKREDHSSISYKRLSTDVSFDLHTQVCEAAAIKGITLKEYVLGAIMTRLKRDMKVKTITDKVE